MLHGFWVNTTSVLDLIELVVLMFEVRSVKKLTRDEGRELYHVTRHVPCSSELWNISTNKENLLE